MAPTYQCVTCIWRRKKGKKLYQ